MKQNCSQGSLVLHRELAVAGTGWWLGATRSVTPPPLWIAPWISTLLVVLAIKMMCPLLGASGLLEARARRNYLSRVCDGMTRGFETSMARRRRKDEESGRERASETESHNSRL
ncbi:hypothetical protein V8C26DRAFT_367582 [Trichoderma gracile]